MRKPKAKQDSPAVKKAKAISNKYKASPGKSMRCRRALIAIENKEVTIRKATEMYGLSYGYLQRRLHGEVRVESRNGPTPIFNKTDEEAMARWLKEMASRGMGLKPAEFLDFVQNLVTKEKKITPFKNNRPGYEWYYAFMERNSKIVEMRTETSLETCRAKLTQEKTDTWYSSFRQFISTKGLMDRPDRIWNADETGFSMGSISGKVIGPTRAEQSSQVPHLTGGHSKQRLSVMFCGAADGKMLPPYFIFPEPRPRGYNPLSGALYGSDIAYTKKGWMDAQTFERFLEHFHVYAGAERPVVLLIDSVSSHISMSAFELASKRGIELYRIVPNATHLMQPLDVGVFGPMKQRWHQVVRKHTRNNPGTPINKENFAEKLKEAFLLFYKPLTVINAFRSAGIYPVDGTMITKEKVRPGATFTSTVSDEVDVEGSAKCASSESSPALFQQTQPDGPALALRALESAMTTPTRSKYAKRLEEGYDVEGQSPCFDVYKRLTLSCEPVRESQPVCGLELLASVCSQVNNQTQHSVLSPTLKEALAFPTAEPKKVKRKSHIADLPDNLTSPNSLRTMSLKGLSKIRAIRNRELKAKKKYIAQSLKKTCAPKSKSTNIASKACVKRNSKKKAAETSDGNEDFMTATCMYCHVTSAADEELGTERIWVQCDLCDKWLHMDCSEEPVLSDDDFYCQKCKHQ